MFHGQGGYDWYAVYNMPIWLRKFTIQSINAYYENQNKEVEKAKKASPPKVPKGPNIKSPTYAVKNRK